MSIRKSLILTAALALAMLIWLAWPFYQFYGHRNELPLGPFGWIELPDSPPQRQTLHDPAYRNQAAQAMDALRHHRKRLGLPALSAAVAVRGELVWAGTIGWQDIESSTPATPDTMFRIGSTSKALTATALARLVDAGTIELDAPIENYLNPLPNPEWTGITPRMLASHMAGLPHYRENSDWLGLYRSVSLSTRYETMADALDVFDGSDLLFEPGTEFHYSSLGTVLLGAVIGAAADRSYREVMQREVFAPTAMNATIVAPPRAEGTASMATSYLRDGASFRPWRPVDQSHRLPAGGWAATSSDLARMGIAWLDDGYISAATRQRFWTPQQLASGEINSQEYA
ncbi:MAG: serine hydrolase domain-containing protein, partial [Wenzhouxiangellaceae bacterium]